MLEHALGRNLADERFICFWLVSKGLQEPDACYSLSVESIRGEEHR